MLRPSPPLLPLLGSAYLLAWNTWVRAPQGDYRGTTSLQPHNAIFELHPVSKPRPLTAEWTHTHTHSLLPFPKDLFRSLLQLSDLEIPAPPPPLPLDYEGVCDDRVAPLPPPVDDDIMAPLHYLDKGTSVRGTCTTHTGTV